MHNAESPLEQQQQQKFLLRCPITAISLLNGSLTVITTSASIFGRTRNPEHESYYICAYSRDPHTSCIYI